MAILTGFPPSNTISPSVRIAEQDLSIVTAQQTFHQAGLVGFASKGPINLPTLISSNQQLATVFGYPHPESGDPYMLYAAQAYLLVASTLYVVRVAQTDNVNFEQAATATITAPSAGGQIQIISNVAGPYTFTVDSFFRWSLNGVISSQTLAVLAGTYTTDQLVAWLNGALNPTSSSYAVGIQFFNSGGFIGVETTFAYGPNSTLELVSVQNSAYGGALVADSGTNVTGLGQGMTNAQAVGTADRYPYPYGTSGQFDFTGLTGLNLNIVVDGTDNGSIDNFVQTVDLSALQGTVSTSEQVVNAINDQLVANGGTLPGGWEAFQVGDNIAIKTLGYGKDSQLRIKGDSTAIGLFGFTDYTYAGVSPSGTSGGATYNYGIVAGSTAQVGDTSFTITADSPGIDGNATQVVISNNIRQGTFDIAIFNNGVQVETWGGLTKDQTSTYYVETYLSLVSDYIRIQDNTDNPAPPANGTYQLSGGSDGIPSDPDVQDTLLIGDSVAYTGLYGLSDPEQIDIDLIAIPGHSSTSVVLSLLDFCQNQRQDCLAIVDPPFGLTVNEITAWQNGTHPLNNTQFNSDFGALWWPWVMIYDSYNQLNIWAPPSGSIMAMIANSDNIAAPWYAPAGLNRGFVPGVLDVFSRPTLSERDLMYGYSNAVNTIIQFPDVNGFVAWGQKTLQRTPSALDRINVRRMLFVAEKQIRVAARSLLFDPNDAILQARFVSIASAILETIQVGRGLTAFTVQCDSSLNTPAVVDANELRAKIGIQPTYAAEFIYIQFSVFSAANFPVA